MYVLHSMICSDVNECNTANGGCNQICTNTIGSFLCSCNTGYELDSDQRTCVGEFMAHTLFSILLIVYDILVIQGSVMISFSHQIPTSVWAVMVGVPRPVATLQAAITVSVMLGTLWFPTTMAVMVSWTQKQLDSSLFPYRCEWMQCW